MKNLHHLLLCLIPLTSSYAIASEHAAPADLSFSGNVSLTSDYRWRGQTQTQNDPALQGNFVLSHASGFYLAAFASNVDFGDEAHLELDPQIGYTAPITLGSIQPAVDLGMLRYNYIGNRDLNYNEYYFKMIFNTLLLQNDSFTPSISYTDHYGGKAASDSMGKDISNWYFNLVYAAPIAQTNFGANASLGYSKANQEIYGSEAEDHFFDWKIGATYRYVPLEINAELAAVGSNLKTEGFTDENKKGVKTAAVFTLSKSF